MPILPASKLPVNSPEYQRRLQENSVTPEEAKTRKGWAQGLARVRKAMEAPFIVRSDLIKDIGRQVRERREAGRMTGADLQEASGINRAEISKLENGKLNPTIELLERIAASLNCRVEVTFIRNKKEGE